MAMTRAPKKQKAIQTEPFRLLDLPPELWSRIVRAVVTEDKSVHSQKHYLSNDKIIFRQPPISTTCRTVRAEALKFFYSQNDFFITDFCLKHQPEALRKWVTRQMHNGHWNLIKRVSVGFCCIEKDAMAEELKRCFLEKKVELRYREPYDQIFDVELEEV